MSVKTVLRQSIKVSTRKTGDNLDQFNARLLNRKKSDLISLVICHDEESGRSQIPINSFLACEKFPGY